LKEIFETCLSIRRGDLSSMSAKELYVHLKHGPTHNITCEHCYTLIKQKKEKSTI
jgi:hypothetical protein